MNSFDPHILSDLCSDDDLANLRYFGVQQALCVSHATRRFERPQDWTAYLDSLFEVQLPRLEKAGIQPWVALGLSPGGLSRRLTSLGWEALKAKIGQPEVKAIGEVGLRSSSPEEYLLLEENAALASKEGLPLLVRLPRTTRRNLGVLTQVLAISLRAGLPQRRLLLAGLSALEIETLHPIEGPYFSLKNLDEEGLSAASLRVERWCASASMGVGEGDVLRPQRIIRWLEKGPFNDHDRLRIARGNALRWLGLSHT